MGIHRMEHKNGYLAVSNQCIRDGRLSLKARGLLLFMLAHPDDWRFSVSGLVAESGEKETTVRGAMKELEQHGYLRTCRKRLENGRLGETVFDVYEKPDVEKPDVEKPDVEKPDVVSPHVVKQALLNTDTELNTEKTYPLITLANNCPPEGENEQSAAKKRKKFIPPTLEEVTAYVRGNGYHMNPEAFMDYYGSNGWKVGKNHMRDWQAAARNWERREKQGDSSPSKPQRKILKMEDWERVH